MISVLLPTRRRPENLKRSIECLRSLAKRPSQIEFVLYVDDDDRSTIDFVRSACDRRIMPHILPRLGYLRLHECYNLVARAARGDYLLFWNDDTDMLTEGWDDEIRRGPVHSVQFPRRDTAASADYTFMVIGRPVFQAVGHISLSTYSDAWCSHVSRYSGVAIVRDDIVFHHHCLTDVVASEKGDDEGRHVRAFHDQWQIEARQKDIAAIVNASWYAARFAGYTLDSAPYPEQLPYDYVVGGAPRASESWRLL